MKKKKGISEIVSTVLIVMIAIGAIAIIAAFVYPMIRDNLTSGQACLKALQDVSLDSDTTCINKSNNNNINSTIYLGVQKGSDASINLVKLQTLLYKEDGTRRSKEINVSEIGLNERKIFNVSYNQTAEGNYVAVTIAPILKIGNKEKFCEAPETKTPLVNCR